MPKITIDDMVDFVNNWDEEKFELYGGVDNLLKILEKKDRLFDLDLESNVFEEHRDRIFWTLVNSDDPEVRKKTYYRIKKNIINNDLEEIGGKWFMVRERQDLADFFCSQSNYRHDSSYSIAKGILSDDAWEPWHETTDNVYRDVVEELNQNNYEYLKERISAEIVGDTMGVNTDLLEEICNEINCDGDSIIITQDMLDRIMRDEKTTMLVLKQIGLDGDLHNIHTNAYNSAYHNECFRKVERELSEFFDIEETKWIPQEKAGKTYYKHLISVDSKIDEFIYKFLESNHKYLWRDSLEYQGSYSGVLNKLMSDGDIDCLQVNIPEYADYREVESEINSIFKEYI